MNKTLQLILGMVIPAGISTFAGWFSFFILPETPVPGLFWVIHLVLPMTVALFFYKKYRLISIGIVIALILEIALVFLTANYFFNRINF